MKKIDEVQLEILSAKIDVVLESSKANSEYLRDILLGFQEARDDFRKSVYLADQERTRIEGLHLALDYAKAVATASGQPILMQAEEIRGMAADFAKFLYEGVQPPNDEGIEDGPEPWLATDAKIDRDEEEREGTLVSSPLTMIDGTGIEMNLSQFHEGGGYISLTNQRTRVSMIYRMDKGDFGTIARWVSGGGNA